MLELLKKMSVSTVVKRAKEIAKDTVVEEVKYTGAKFMYNGINSITDTVKKNVNNEVKEIMTMPQQMALELKKQSSHQNGQPFQKNFNNGLYNNQYDYFNDYYNSQKNRYKTTPQSNLAEILYQKESHIMDKLNVDMYNRYKR